MNAVREYRCPHDNKLLFKGILIDSTIEIKCKYCHDLVTFEGVSNNSLICMKGDCPNRIHRPHQ